MKNYNKQIPPLRRGQMPQQKKQLRDEKLEKLLARSSELRTYVIWFIREDQTIYYRKFILPEEEGVLNNVAGATKYFHEVFVTEPKNGSFAIPYEEFSDVVFLDPPVKTVLPVEEKETIDDQPSDAAVG